jgi:antitoxin ParD1/3/4
LNSTGVAKRGIINPMNTKLKVTVESDLAAFLEQYRTTHQLKTRSEVVEAAIQTLRRAELEQNVHEAANDPEQRTDADWWAFTNTDGCT